jgi:DNA-binding XRE family transcriptional regulator
MLKPHTQQKTVPVRGRDRLNLVLDMQRLAEAIRVRRGSKSFKEAAKDIGLSELALARIEKHGVMPELATYISLCKWLDLPMEYFVWE